MKKVFEIGRVTLDGVFHLHATTTPMSRAKAEKVAFRFFGAGMTVR